MVRPGTANVPEVQGSGAYGPGKEFAGRTGAGVSGHKSALLGGRPFRQPLPAPTCSRTDGKVGFPTTADGGLFPEMGDPDRWGFRDTGLELWPPGLPTRRSLPDFQVVPSFQSAEKNP